MPTLDVSAAARRLRERIGPVPDVVLVLGSGLAALADAVEGPVAVGFGEIAGLPATGVAGHAGRWVAGTLEGRRVLLQAGRYHLYEGHPIELVCAPVRIAAALGGRALVLTNAAGGIRPTLAPGTLVRITDHLDLMGRSPELDAGAGSGGPPWDGALAPAGAPYDAALGALAERCAGALGTPLERGVYAALTGPSYETPAEIRALARMGADLVGMSTVPEALAARAAGMRCLALSLVTNHAAGISPRPLDHAEVIEIGRRSAGALERLLRAFVRELAA